MKIVFFLHRQRKSPTMGHGERLIPKAEPPLASKIPFPDGFRAQTRSWALHPRHRPHHAQST